ncbi:MAG TPA: hypothetical protein VFE18_15735 [Phenylobacterium sp.]|jgi:hypothetical protein|uniref:hypothetical protein n=1 Tax=Phenylobacterium sp. TaxID=1871053 RepID=UPI002D71EF44|nr:hypothetical protein [Phenylobacterium sp.]HZZ69622.1 hypothetical protein [Phenylobacterium sp.]
MVPALNQILSAFGRWHALAGHPIAVVVTFALIAALIEQRLARRRTPDFSVAWRDIHGAPPKPRPAKRPPEGRQDDADRRP